MIRARGSFLKLNQQPGIATAIRVRLLDRVDIQYVQMNALMMDRMDIKARGVCS
jgi:hypothetical protein